MSLELTGGGASSGLLLLTQCEGETPGLVPGAAAVHVACAPGGGRHRYVRALLLILSVWIYMLLTHNRPFDLRSGHNFTAFLDSTPPADPHFLTVQIFCRLSQSLNPNTASHVSLVQILRQNAEARVCPLCRAQLPHRRYKKYPPNYALLEALFADGAHQHARRTDPGPMSSWETANKHLASQLCSLISRL